MTTPSNPPVLLTIAGFDPSSGAGITADLQVFAAHGLYATACITALTVQSTRGVTRVESVAGLIAPTLEHLDADLPPLGIKIGMLATAEAVRAVAQYLRKLRGRKIPVLLDPVFLSSSGAALLDAEGLAALQRELLPLVDWITPNRDELAALSGVESTVEDGLQALAGFHPHLHIVATGGDHIGPATVDLLLTAAGELHRFEGERIQTTSTHGTGCAFSSALLARLVLGDAPVAAVAAAKAYVTEALRQAPGVGRGNGPLNLLWPLRQRSKA
ncbi:MAG TPA: bifunctional hydroxymethylpyrimidine kinase/phosphomethylpyrimidine kinase [Acidobacteriaceae bacterium]|nr:bifunctional hydroxymethylpyrimidine kinase/phosphomethylpyrimidine kinase [Acidobacteriaceae bacterium]